MLATRAFARLVVSVVALACFLGTASAASAAPITIDPGNYQGRYYLPGVTGCCSYAKTTFDLADGTYSLDTGATIAGSYGSSSFAFTVSGGTLTPVANGSASSSGNTLSLRNTTVTINPGSYTGRYFLTAFGPGREFVGAQTVVLVPDLVYVLDDGAEIVATIGGTPTPSNFIFAVSAAGAVSVVPGPFSPPASAVGSEIDLNSVPLHVYASPATVSYRLCSQPAGTVVSGNITSTVIPGLANCVSDGVNAGYFVASPTGVLPASLTVGTLTAVFATPASSTPTTLISATASLVQTSAAYLSLPTAQQTQINQALALLTQSLGQLASLSPAQIAAYDAAIGQLVQAGFLTQSQGAALNAFAATV